MAFDLAVKMMLLSGISEIYRTCDCFIIRKQIAVILFNGAKATKTLFIYLLFYLLLVNKAEIVGSVMSF